VHRHEHRAATHAQRAQSICTGSKIWRGRISKSLPMMGRVLSGAVIRTAASLGPRPAAGLWKRTLRSR